MFNVIFHGKFSLFCDKEIGKFLEIFAFQAQIWLIFLIFHSILPKFW